MAVPSYSTFKLFSRSEKYCYALQNRIESDPTYTFEVLVASRAEDTGLAYLSYIDENGMMDDIDTWKRYIIIGSYETRVAVEFLINQNGTQIRL
jgi:hypothetical protein